jgi:Di-haem oxidoreductase, putative peroxidase
MKTRNIRCLALVLFTLIGVGQAQQTDWTFTPVIPKTWDDRAMASLELPLPGTSVKRDHVSSDYYYRIPVRPIYKSYPVYTPGREPAGYEKWLKEREAETVFDASQLKTEADWIAAGEVVFNSPIFYDVIVRVADVKDLQWHEKVGVRSATDGTLPYFRYVVREKGKVELGTISCAMCHTRLMPDGTVISGAQGNFPFERAGEFFARATFTPERIRIFERSFFGVPWIKPDPQAGLDDLSLEQIAEWHGAIPPGVIARHGSNPRYPPKIPDLIGVKDRKYLDHTGLQLHRSLVDMMRYSALNQGADFLDNYGGFIPGARDFRTLPDPSTRHRYSDEQLYALSLYLYSLMPPANPNSFDESARRGQQIFKREGCAECHTPPLYTNNKLIPVDSFKVPQEHLEKYDVMPISIGTDSSLTLKTRRGTGYYKVPSLKGLWYRSPLEHSGSVQTLEDWFDSRRLGDDYVPTGFRGAGVKTRPVKGHKFGLKLTAAERRDLIAFLKTL